MNIKVDSYYREDSMHANATFAGMMFIVSTDAARPSLHDMGWQPRDYVKHYGANGTQPQGTALLTLEPDGAGALTAATSPQIPMNSDQPTNSTRSRLAAHGQRQFIYQPLI